MTTVVCFGDSNTWGCPPYSNIAQTAERMDRDKRWPNVMGAKMTSKMESPVWIVEEGLGGRTTVFDNPIEGEYRNGARTILAVIETHAPMDVVIIMLGTNDFKDQFSISSYDSSRGMLTLIQMIKGHYALIERGPEILIVTPPIISKDAEPTIWRGGYLRAVDHAYYLEQVANRTGCFHFDANKVVKVGADGVHLDEAAHIVLGKALAGEVGAILRMREAK